MPQKVNQNLYSPIEQIRKVLLKNHHLISSPVYNYGENKVFTNNK